MNKDHQNIFSRDMGHYEETNGSFVDTQIRPDLDSEEERNSLGVMLSGLQSKLLELSSWLQKIDPLQRAKELAYEKATGCVRNHCDELIQDIKSQQENMLKDMELAHTQEMQSLDDLHSDVSGKLQGLQDNMQSGVGDMDVISQVEGQLSELLETLPVKVWNTRSVVRFIPHGNDVVLGTLQQCYLTEDYNRVTRVRMHSPRASESDGDLRHAVLTRNMRQRTESETSVTFECTSKGNGDNGQRVSTEKEGKKAEKKSSLIRSLSNIVTRKSSLKVAAIKKSNSFSEAQSTKRPEAAKPKLRPAPGKPITEVNVRFNCSIQTTSNTGTPCHGLSIQYLPNGDLLLSGQSRVYRITPTSPEENPGLFVNDLMRPAGITLNKDGYVLICDQLQHNIKAFTRGGLLCSKFGTGYFQNPISVASTSQDHLIVLDQTDTGRYVYMYQPMVGSKHALGFDVTDNYILHHPSCVCVGNDDIVYICDPAKHAVYMFDTHGLYMGAIECCQPENICVDTMGLLYIVNHDSVRVYTPRGQYIRDILGYEHGVNEAYAISVAPHRQLAVLQKQCLLLFDLN